MIPGGSGEQGSVVMKFAMDIHGFMTIRSWQRLFPMAPPDSNTGRQQQQAASQHHFGEATARWSRANVSVLPGLPLELSSGQGKILGKSMENHQFIFFISIMWV